jgi:CHAT domain-containing protein/lipopolysaccharide biosynthesis regulator YciM
VQPISPKYAILALLSLLGIQIILADYPLDSLQARSLERIGQEMLDRSQFDSASMMFAKASEIWEQHSCWQEYLQTRLKISYNLLFKNDYSSAYGILTEAEKIMIEHPDIERSILGRIYILQGYIHNTKEEYSDAIERISKGVTVYSNTIGTENATFASALYALGSAEYSLGRYETSYVLLKKAEDLQKHYIDPNSSQVAVTKVMIGLVFDAKNEFDEAIATFLDALRIFREHHKDNSPEAGLCYLNLLSTFRNKGDYEQAVAYGKKAIDVYHRIGLPDDANVASAYCTLGEVYTALGDFDNAQTHLQRSLDLFREKHPGKKAVIGVLHQLFAKMYDRTGDREKALEYSMKGIALLEQSYGPAHPQIGFMYEHVGDIYSAAGRFREALTYYRKALAAREHIGTTHSRNDVAVLNSSIAHVYIKMNRLDSAALYIAKASDVQHRSRQKNVTQQALLLKRQGDLYRAQKQYDKALQSYQDGIVVLRGETPDRGRDGSPAIEQSVYKKETLELLGLTASLFEERYESGRQQNDLKRALTHYTTALDLVDDLRRQYSMDGSKLTLSEQSASFYDNACRLAVTLFRKTNDPSYKEQAFLIADRGKANVLLDKLFDGEAKQFAGIPDSLLEAENRLLKQIAFLEIQIQKSAEKNDAVSSNGELSAQKFDLRSRHARLMELFEREYPEYYELKYARNAATVAEIQSAIGRETTVIQYLAGKREIYAFALTGDRLTVHVLPNTGRINELVARFTGALRRYDEKEYRSSGTALYQAIVRPLESSFAAVKNIVFIPDGNLHYVPFDALPMTPVAGTTTDITSIRYLITQCTVSYSYSAAFYMKMHAGADRRTDYKRSFAGFAPVFRDSVKNGDFLANRSFVEGSGMSDHRSITLDGRRFNELPYSEQEIGSIARSFSDRTMPYKTFLHTDATETNFKRFGKGYDILHVATHGFINETNPKLSAILFSQPLSAGMEDDGILYMSETFNLDLDADLVVLSSCESGVGTLVQGEGMMALTRGLFYAGARNIIYSLWKVSDKQTYLLMDRFYAELHSGKSYAASLRQAKLSMIASKESAFPAKWCGFVLMGE